MSDTVMTNGVGDSEGMIFKILKKTAGGAAAARLGRLSLPRRKPIETPNYIAMASRGVIPHITPDHLSKFAPFSAAYMALEDFIERKDPAALSIPSPDKSPLHTFTCFPETIATVLAARRCPAIRTPMGNGPNSVAIFTSTGFRNLTTDEHAAAVATLRPDIAIGPADLFNAGATPPNKKLIRAAERTEAWTDVFLNPARRAALKEAGVAVFAPVPAVPHRFQKEHLANLADDLIDSLSGLAVYDVDLLQRIEEDYKPLAQLPRLSMHIPESPHDVLRQIALGVDVCHLPFLNAISDAGVALTFTFPPPADGDTRPLGVDMWQQEHETALTPLAEGCECYACKTHHRAFVHHLLNAKEMLGWTLLQIHNHQVVAEFFSGVRVALAEGRFAEDAARFESVYEKELPQGTGTRPRARGYHFKGEASPSKINPPAWENFSSDDEGTAGARSRSKKGARVAGEEGTETPLVPDVGSQELQAKGFAEVDGDKTMSGQ